MLIAVTFRARALALWHLGAFALMVSGIWMLPACASAIKHSAPPDVSIQVVVSAIWPGQGPVRCAVFADKATFLSRAGIHNGTSADASAEKMRFTLRAPEGAEIVVSVFQDLNNNEALDRGAFGAPTEPWVVSGKPLPLGPPIWSACAIRAHAGMTIDITLMGQE